MKSRCEEAFPELKCDWLQETVKGFRVPPFFEQFEKSKEEILKDDWKKGMTQEGRKACEEIEAKIDKGEIKLSREETTMTKPEATVNR